MLNKNNIQTGILIGLILPIISVLIFELAFKDWIYSKRGIPYFVIVAVNLVLLRYFASKKRDSTANGMMIVTFVFMALVYFFRFR